MFDVKSEFVTNCADVSPAGVADQTSQSTTYALIVVDVGGDDDGAASDVDDKP